MEGLRQRLRHLFTATGLACLVAGIGVFAPLGVPQYLAPRADRAWHTAARPVWPAHTPAQPIAVMVDEGTHRVFVLAQDYQPGSYPNPQGAGSLSTFDAATGALVRTTRVGVGPVQMALDVAAQRLYVLNRGPLDGERNATQPGSVSVLDAATGALVRTTPVGVGADALAVDERHGRVFALTDDPGATNGQSSGDTSVLDAVTGALVRRLPGVSGTALAVSARTGRLFVASGLSCPPAPTDTNKAELGCLEVLNARTGHRLATRPLAERVGQRAMAADDVTGHVVAMQEGSRDGQDPDQFVSHVALLDATTGATLRRATTNGYWETNAFALSVTAGRAVVVEGPDAYDIQMSGGGPETISVVDTRSGRMLHTTAGPVEPYGFVAEVVIDARTGRIVVLMQPIADLTGALREHATLMVLDARTGRLLHTTPGQVGDVALGLDASRGYLFVANARSNTVRLLNIARL